MRAPGPSAEETRAWVEQEQRAQAARFLDAMGEDQLNLTVNLLCLEHASEGVPYDVSARAAAASLRTRIQELSDLRDALNEIYLEASEAHFVPLLISDAPLPAYMKGLYLFCEEIISALTSLASGLRILQPDWAELRRRITDADVWYFNGLPREIQDELARLPVSEEIAVRIGGRLEELFWAASYLHQGLEKRFG
jgi:hypothetical protein